MKPKVFCVGFHKTGTTSLKAALHRLGYRVTGPNGVRNPHISTEVYAMADSLVRKYDAFQDNPWPVIFKEMDARHPGSRFILTTRDSASWIESQVRHFGLEETPMRQWIYGAGCPQGNEALYLSRYESHNQEVLDYFGGRPDALLVMNLAAGDGWDKLCPFLGADVPEAPFPHANKAESRNACTRALDSLLRPFRS